MEKNIPLLRNFNPYTAIFEEDSQSLSTEVPTWSAVLLQCQRVALKQRYKRPKKKRIKLMTEIRRKVPKVDPLPTREDRPNALDIDPDQQALPFTQMARAYSLYPLTSLDLTDAYLGSKMTTPIRQCMNFVFRKNPIRRTR